MNLITLHKADDAKVISVINEMRTRGAPTLRAVDMGDDVWVALEGTHRICAAKGLGLTPIITPIAYGDDELPEDIQDEVEEYGVTIEDFVDSVYRSATQGRTEIVTFA